MANDTRYLGLSTGDICDMACCVATILSRVVTQIGLLGLTLTKNRLLFRDPQRVGVFQGAVTSLGEFQKQAKASPAAGGGHFVSPGLCHDPVMSCLLEACPSGL